MKRIYLVDSENVGDIWVPLLAASQSEEEVIVFYTQKSPHMNYENVRLLKETEKEAEFIKCFEGSNALDFQLVTQLGYMLCENQENCYVIVSNDTGFDAAVRYWKQRNMPVWRISGKELSRRLQQKAKTDEDNVNKTVTEQTEKFADKTVTEQTEKFADNVNKTVTEQTEKFADNADKIVAEQTEEFADNEKKTVAEQTVEFADNVEETVAEQTVEFTDNEKETVAEQTTEFTDNENKTVAEQTEEFPDNEKETVEEQTQTKKYAKSEEMSESEEIQMEIPDEIMRPGETADADSEKKITAEKPEISKEQDEVIRSLLTCISKDRLADFHNALILFFGEEIGKELYQDAKNSSVYAICRENQNSISEEEKFDVYCRTVFSYSDPKLDCPEDFSSFLYKANAERKNLNSLRAALQGHYGKDKGMKYYSLFKSHIKIMNRM